LSALESSEAWEERVPRQPKYYRLKRHLLELTHELPPGTLVPTERALAQDFDTSRTTVRQALQELVAEGRLERVQGRGTFVAHPKVAQRLQMTSYTEDMRAQGLNPTSRLIDVRSIGADKAIAERLRLRVGGKVHRIQRLRMANGDPMALETTHLSVRRFPGLVKHFSEYSSLYALLREVYGVHLCEAEETIETALATPEETALLGTDVGLPMLQLSRHSFIDGGVPVEWVRALYRGDRYKFVTTLTSP
jgi:GntR family transcriptional regulator